MLNDRNNHGSWLIANRKPDAFFFAEGWFVDANNQVSFPPHLFIICIMFVSSRIFNILSSAIKTA